MWEKGAKSSASLWKIIFVSSRWRGFIRELLLLHHQLDLRHRWNLLHQDQNFWGRPDPGVERKRVRLASRGAALASRTTSRRPRRRNGQGCARVERQDRRLRRPRGHFQPQDHRELVCSKLTCWRSSWNFDSLLRWSQVFVRYLMRSTAVLQPLPELSFLRWCKTTLSQKRLTVLGAF